MDSNAVLQQKVDHRNKWKPGQSGNPNGRPRKGHSIVEHIEHYLVMTQEQLKKQDLAKLNLAHQIAIKYVLDCYQHPNHTDKLMDRLYGQPQSAVDVTTKGNELKQSPIYNIISPNTKVLLGKLENGDRMEPDKCISQEPASLPESASSAEPE